MAEYHERDHPEFEKLGDLLDDIALPIVGARFAMGVDVEGNRQSAFDFHYDEKTVTPAEVVGLVIVSTIEWLHDVLHGETK